MAKPIKVLIVEESTEDTELMLRELRRSGLEPRYEQVGDERALRAALERVDWDIVICDHALPGLDSLGALRAVQESADDLPFIVVSGVIGEEAAVEVMKAGAQDYVTKDRLARLAPAIERAIAEAQARYQRRLTEQAMDESEDRLREAARLARLGHWIWDDIDGAPTYFSEEFARIHGLTREECSAAIGSAAGDLKWVHPEDRRRYRSIVKSASAQGCGFDIEYRIVRRDGSVRYLREVGKPIEEECTGQRRTLRMIQDITEQKQAEAALRASDERLRGIADNLPALIVYMDKDMRYRFVNRTCEIWYARPAARILGKTLSEILGEHAATFTSHVKTVLGGKTEIFEADVTYPDGATRTIHATYVPHLDHRSRVQGFFALIEDITDRHAIEDRLRQAQKMESIGALTGGIAHDFNNILAIILGHAEILEGKLGEDESIAAVIRAATRGSQLTARLLAVSREQKLEPKTIDLNHLVASMADLVRRALGQAIEVEVAAGDELPFAHADPGQVENAILNLAINARDAMPDGGRLRIATAKALLDEDDLVGIKDSSPGDYVMLAMSDTGTGMTPEVMSQVFDPFFTTKKSGRGTGLGLSMVYGFAKQSGGHVAIESTPGVGTTVRLYLPISRDDAGRAPVDQDDLAAAPRAHGETVMIVEDLTDLLNATTTTLEALGYSVLAASEGNQALNVLGNAPDIDLLLCDIVLPGGMSGWKIAEEARRLRPTLPILFMSGNVDTPGVRRPPTNGSTDLLKKPFRRSELARRVRRAIDASERGA